MNYRPCIVYVQGNWRRVGKKYEAKFEQRALEAAQSASRALNIPLYVKAHPNFRGVLRAGGRNQNIRVIDELDQLSLHHLIFLNTISTAYFSFSSYGPTIFLGDDLLDPRRVFGHDISYVTLDKLAEELAKFQAVADWAAIHQAQLSHPATV